MQINRSNISFGSVVATFRDNSKDPRAIPGYISGETRGYKFYKAWQVARDAVGNNNFTINTRPNIAKDDHFDSIVITSNTDMAEYDEEKIKERIEGEDLGKGYYKSVEIE